jgi:UDP-N-acetylmuramate dehydrogenase
LTINGLVRWTVGRGLAGLEAWAGTPGTVGGAIHGNAHWSGVNIGDRTIRVILATVDGALATVPAAEMQFGYDRSRLKHTREVVVAADFRVAPGDPGELRREARRSLEYRKRTQPLAQPSAGCVFQNPDPAVDVIPDGVPASAGALVDRAGFKGRRVGGARISDTHANFIVNDGTATAADIRALIEMVREGVRRQIGVTHRDEVDYVGTF